VDVRIVAATNKNLAAEIRSARFREDLFYRLNVIPFLVPPLRERHKDIPVMAEYFVEVFAAEHGRPRKTLVPETLEAMMRYAWPGNVRELRNEIERLVIMVPGMEIVPGDLSLPDGSETTGTLQATRARYERELILAKLEENAWNISRTSRMLGLESSHLYRKMKAYGISKG
jgi:two-component system nitrogen regulation response regulator NtrX